MTQPRSTEESEAFAKNWQVDVVSRQVAEGENARQRDTQEIKMLIGEVNKSIRESGFITRGQLDSELKLIDEKYGPLKKAVYWLAGTMVAIILSAAFNLFINISNGGIGK